MKRMNKEELLKTRKTTVFISKAIWIVIVLMYIAMSYKIVFVEDILMGLLGLTNLVIYSVMVIIVYIFIAKLDISIKIEELKEDLQNV